MSRMGHRRRQLSADELALWRSVADTANPIRARDASLASPPARPETSAAPAERRLTVAEFSIGAKAAPFRDRIDLAPDPHQAFVPDPHRALAAAPPEMDRRTFRKLRRGRLDPDARIDLHGMTAERAHAALTAFVLGASNAGHRLVLVITGKGRVGEAGGLAPHRIGVLRHAVPHWLSLPPLAPRVLQVAPAHLRHGGGGAYYVSLRRLR